MSDYTREAEMALDMVRLRRELEAMKAERDVLVNRVDFLNQQNSAQQEQNDALAAHVERMTSRANAVFAANNVSAIAGMAQLLEAVDEAPKTSLARLKAQWQAEALDDAAEAFELEGCHIAAAQALRCSAAELRRQAEENAK